jgi:dipeptidyl aminopeptidase/acylaminoacyl peptidase
MGRTRAPRRRAVTTRRLLAALLALLLLAGGAVAALPLVADELPASLADLARLPERLWTRVFPPRVSAAARLAGLTGAEQEAVARLGARLDGRLVWSSNRSGNHELYLLDLRARTLRQLTRHPHVDFFSRFSPDGRRIVFLRSQRPWVSFRDPTAWDVYLIQADGSGEEPIARGAYHPTWTADGRGLVFHRGARVVRYDLATRQETLLFDGGREIPGLTQFGDPELSPDERRLAFYPRGAMEGTAVFDLGTRTLVALTPVQACQPVWAPDGRTLVWVEIEGNGGTRIVTGSADGTGRRVLIDLPGARSHEYFPKLSNDGRWLVWGAAAEGHEHDRADYDIFAWEVGTPWESALRVSQHPANDQWPDLWVPPAG